MGDVGVFVICTTIVLITSLGLILGWINYKINKLKDEIDDVYLGKENAAAAVGVLEGLIRNLNAVCHDHQKRLDILEEDHPDDEIDYGTVDDNGNITEVWFEGKRYVPEDKRDEDNATFYADGRVVAETTRPEEKHCCATCRYYRPGPDHTCTIRPWLQVTKQYATNAHSACNNYKKAYTPTKGQVDYPYSMYKDMGGNSKADELQIKIDYITLLRKQEKITNKTRRFNKQLSYALESGIMSVREWKEFMEDLDSNV